MDPGDIYLADLHHERRDHVLVLSSSRFHQISQRVIVAPRIRVAPIADELPWRITVDSWIFAVDLLRSVPIDALLDRVDRAPARATNAARRAMLAIT